MDDLRKISDLRHPANWWVMYAPFVTNSTWY